jgi:DNA-binding SARP family transcriptional activator
LDEQPLAFPTRKALALLVYLAVEGDLQPRPKLMALFWPDSDAERGRSALRSTLAYLRRAFDTACPDSSRLFLRIEADAIGFDFEAEVALDVRVVETAPGEREAATWQQAVDLYRGDFMEGFSLPDAPDFDDWLSLQREGWHRAMQQVFDPLSRVQADARQFDAAVATAARWVRHDPLDEAAHRRLMEIHTLTGNKAAALQAYRACRSALQAALGIEPSPATQTLAERIRALRLEAPDQSLKPVLSEAEGSQIPNPKSDIPFVGRSAEHQELARCFQQAGQGQTQVVVIEGEAGIGKTRLVAEFLRGLALQGVDCLQGRAFEAGGRLPYQPLVDALRHRLEQENAPDDLLADVWLVELSRLLPELRERYPDLPPPTPDETLGRIRLSEAIARLGKALALRQPVALFLDDVQWADAASLDLLHYAGRAWAGAHIPVLIVLTLRTEALVTAPEVDNWLAMLGREMPLVRLRLPALTADETGELVALLQMGAERRAAGPPEHPPEIVPGPVEGQPAAAFGGWLYRETAGQPFFINETLKALQEQGLVSAPTDPGQSWIIDQIPSTDILPPGVRQVILTRLRQLSPNAMALLTAAAVLGRPCRFERLCQVTDLAEMAALPGLEMLLARHLLLETPDAARPYALAHDKIRDVVYTEAGDARRRIFHRRAFEALEQTAAPPGELAHHALIAHLTEPAFHYSIAAGDAAMRLFAVHDAITQYEQARHQLAISNEPLTINNLQKRSGPISDLYTHLARAYEIVEESGQVEQVCQEMLALARTSGWPTLECAALNRLASLAIYTQQMDRARTLLSQAQQVAEAGGDQAGLAQTEWSLGQLTHHVHDFEASQAHSERALALARELGDQALIAGATQTLAFALLFQGQITRGKAAMAEAKDGYVALGNRVQEADALVGLAFAHILAGEAAQGVEAARLAYAIGQEIENEFGQCMSRPWLVCGLVDRGVYEEALPIAQHNLAVARSQALAPKLLAALSAGLLYWAVGDYAAARQVHLELMPQLEEAGVPGYLEQNLANLCVDAALAGEWAMAQTYARQALVYRDYRTLPLLITPHWPETEALLRGGEVELAREDARRWGELVGSVPRLQLGYLRSLALLAEWDGDLEQAIAHLNEALTLAESIDLPGEQWQIWAKLGELYRVMGEEAQARQALGKAAEIAQALAARIDDEGLRTAFLAAESVRPIMASTGKASIR